MALQRLLRSFSRPKTRILLPRSVVSHDRCPPTVGRPFVAPALNRTVPRHRQQRACQQRQRHDKTPSSSSSSNSTSQPQYRDRRRRRNSSILPTLDASPLLDPSRYVDRISSDDGTDEDDDGGAQRKLRKRSTVSEGRRWIRNWILYRGDEERGERSGGQGDSSIGSSSDNRTIITRCFALVGHGVPMQLLQSCVNAAWVILGRGEGEGVEECHLDGGDGGLEFDRVTVRTKDGEYRILPWPVPLPYHPPHPFTSSHSHEFDYDLRHSLHIYLTVMTRISSAFSHLVSPPDTLLDDHQSPGGIGFPKPDSWKCELLRGFVYPPSATIFSTAFWNDGEDCRSGERIGDLTSPPIVELERGCYEGDGVTTTTVRIILQGIHSEEMENEEEDRGACRNEGSGGGSRGMVPVSLVFEASFGGAAYDDSDYVL